MVEVDWLLQKTGISNQMIHRSQPQPLLTDIVEPRTIIVVSEVPQAVILGGVTVALLRKIHTLD